MHAAVTKDFLCLVHQSCRRGGGKPVSTSAPPSPQPGIGKTDDIRDQMAANTEGQ